MKLKDAPSFGRYVRLKKTGEICKWKAYDPESETLVVELLSGPSFPVPQQEIGVLTLEEESEFLSSRQKRS